MATIYAPLNAVDTHRTIRTMLPSDVNLTREQHNDLLTLEKKFKTHGESMVVARDFKVQSTNNPGIHYFCVENNFALLYLSSNPNLSPMIVFLLVNKWASEIAPISVMFNLLSNEAVASDIGLFKFVVGKLSDSNFSKQDILVSFLSKMNSVPVELFMFMFEEIGLNGTVTDKRKSLTVAEQRVKEINGWLVNHEDETYQQMATIPFSWVAGMFGYETAGG